TFKGGWVEYGFKEGVVGYTFEGANVKTPDAVIAKMEAAKGQIVAGEIKVPVTIAAAQEYRASLR
ncbi:MAG: hypothetical protein LBT39_06765, partial [Treponema sp.]|nr:hypothetical protein [Treponema sp.]